MNAISTAGAGLMAIGTVVLLYNVVVTSIKNEKVGHDPWEDGRTIEWAISSPPPEYNFKQLPLVRGLDAYWLEKMEGKKEMIASEPIGDIHMPNGSIIPFVISLGLFIAAFGAMYMPDGTSWAIPVLIIGLSITLVSMLVRSVKDDLGYHIHKEDLLEDDDKGGIA